MIEIQHNGDGSGDWVRVIVNGKAIFEGHRISPSDLAFILGQVTDEAIHRNLRMTDEEMEEGAY